LSGGTKEREVLGGVLVLGWRVYMGEEVKYIYRGGRSTTRTGDI
jgi:hypothetical protein